MKIRYDLSKLEWKISGWIPHLWRIGKTMEGIPSEADVPAIPAKVPGSVQYSLREAGVLPDWNVGLNASRCEWVENRHWIYETKIPDNWLKVGKCFRLNCLGLDYSGWVLVNGEEVSPFKGSLIPHLFDITPFLRDKNNNCLEIIFDCPPRWLGQFGFTSQMKDWKPRFNYTWDWTVRLVQIGIWDSLFIESTDGNEIQEMRCFTNVDGSSGTGSVEIKGSVLGDKGRVVRISLKREDTLIRTKEFKISEFSKEGISWNNLPVELWWPNMQGAQPLYILSSQLLDGEGKEIDKVVRRIGFKHVSWRPCKGAPDKADPWICVVNDRPIFLQGVNWTPIRPNFADVTEEDYRQRLELYCHLGSNILRVWGGAYLEKQCFYDLCDELGLMVWQEFPLSSSGADNWPPEDEKSITKITEIAESYISRRQHHVSLTLWCGGNELQGDLDGNKIGIGKPVDSSHPLIKRLQEIVTEQDPSRRFLPTSSSGPRFTAKEEDFGKGLHWDVHGLWRAEGNLEGQWSRYWQNDDALFRSEVGTHGASSAELIRKFRGNCSEFPPKAENPLWRRPLSWFIQWSEFIDDRGREPQNLEEYVAWSQERQKQALTIAVKLCKKRFPCCGGIIIWMGHDCFPCTANLSIIDFEGKPKPVAKAIGEIFRKSMVSGYENKKI